MVRPGGQRVPGSIAWDPQAGSLDLAALEGVDAVVHLAGESIASRWTEERKRRIRESRVKGTRLVAESLAREDAPSLQAGRGRQGGIRRSIHELDRARRRRRCHPTRPRDDGTLWTGEHRRARPRDEPRVHQDTRACTRAPDRPADARARRAPPLRRNGSGAPRLRAACGPARLLAIGFRFRHPELEEALRSILGR